jgi:hypothetical protein
MSPTAAAPEVFGCCVTTEALPGVDDDDDVEVGATFRRRLLGSFCGRNLAGVW